MNILFKDYHITGTKTKSEAKMIAREMGYKDATDREIKAYKIIQLENIQNNPDGKPGDYVFRVLFKA